MELEIPIYGELLGRNSPLDSFLGRPLQGPEAERAPQESCQHEAPDGSRSQPNASPTEPRRSVFGVSAVSACRRVGVSACRRVGVHGVRRVVGV